MYKGDTTETIPIPIPPNIRANTSCSKESLNAQPIPDTEKKTAAINIVTFLPHISLNLPANSTPIIEPIKAQPTNQPIWISSNPNFTVT